MAVLLKGYNHNIGYGGLRFHAQTEFRMGASKQHVESTLFLNGAVVYTIQKTYAFKEDRGMADRLAGLMKTQHRQIVHDLTNGKLNQRIQATPGGAPFVVGQTAPPPGADATSKDGLAPGIGTLTVLPDAPRERQAARPRGTIRLARGSRTVQRYANEVSSEDTTSPEVMTSAPPPTDRAPTDPDQEAPVAEPTSQKAEPIATAREKATPKAATAPTPPPIPTDAIDKKPDKSTAKPEPPSEPPEKRAADHFARGMAALRKGNYEEAREEWLAATRLDDTNPAYKANLALVEQFITAPPRTRKGALGNVA